MASELIAPEEGKLLADGRSLIELLDGRAEKFADKIAFIYEDERHTYSEVFSLSRRIANGLIAGGITKGMRAAILAPNHPNVMIAAIGIIRTGAIWIPVNSRNSAADNAATLRAVWMRCAVLPQ